MTKQPWLFSSVPGRCLGAVLLVAATTGAPLLLGIPRLDHLLVALMYILPVGWSAARWGRWPGACAALAALLAGQFLFFPLHGALALPGVVAWLLGAGLLVGGNWLTDRLQVTLAQSPDRIYEEYQAVFVDGLRTALAGLHTPMQIAATLAAYLQQLLQAGLVEAQVRIGYSVTLTVRSPSAGRVERGPDRVLPLLGAPDRVGEIRLWGDGYLPPEDGYLLRCLAALGARALAQALQPEAALHQEATALAEPRNSVNAGGVPAHGNRATPQS